ncbi:kinase-like domain-containing protein, partial [Rhodocollybia butyracea]
MSGSLKKTQILSLVSLDHFDEKYLTPSDADEASFMIDTLQEELDRTRDQKNPPFRKSYMKALRHLNRLYGVLPPSMFLKDLECHGKHPVTDVWIGHLKEARVCIKVLRFFLQGSNRETLLKALSNEVLLWRQLKHPNILPFLGINTELFSPSFCIVSPWMYNGDIISYTQNYSTNLETKLKYTTQITQGLIYLHGLDPPVVHGDIKGANILLSDNHRCCLADFGLSVLDTKSMNPTHTATAQGSLRWLAPEFISPTPRPTQGSLTSRDIYALGCTVFELFTGCPPFSHHNLDISVAIEVLQGVRPVLPADIISNEIVLGSIRTLLDSCWSEKINIRPTVQSVLDLLAHTRNLLYFPRSDVAPLYLPPIQPDSTVQGTPNNLSAAAASTPAFNHNTVKQETPSMIASVNSGLSAISEDFPLPWAPSQAVPTSTLVHRPQRKREKLPKETLDILSSWLHNHRGHPYPNDEEKNQLCIATGLTKSADFELADQCELHCLWRRILPPGWSAAHSSTPVQRCDEQPGDSCQTCIHLNIECLGRGPKYPEWMDDKPAVEAYRAGIKAQLMRAGLIRGSRILKAGLTQVGIEPPVNSYQGSKDRTWGSGTAEGTIMLDTKQDDEVSEIVSDSVGLHKFNPPWTPITVPNDHSSLSSPSAFTQSDNKIISPQPKSIHPNQKFLDRPKATTPLSDLPSWATSQSWGADSDVFEAEKEHSSLEEDSVQYCAPSFGSHMTGTVFRAPSFGLPTTHSVFEYGWGHNLISGSTGRSSAQSTSNPLCTSAHPSPDVSPRGRYNRSPQLPSLGGMSSSVPVTN